MSLPQGWERFLEQEIKALKEKTDKLDCIKIRNLMLPKDALKTVKR